jgi:Sulfotransferase domain
MPDLRKECWKAWRLLSAPARFLPDFFVPGAPKCGTSSLYDCLRLHPQFATSKRKEPTNFIHAPTSELCSRMNFPLRCEQWTRGPMIAGEASVEYFTHPEAAKNISRMIPRAKLIFMLRDPLRRAWSDYKMFQKCGADKNHFSESVTSALKWLENPGDQPLIESALSQSNNPLRYVYAGAYMDNLEKWLACFPREQCLFLLSEDFFADPAAVMARVFAFLGMREFILPHVPHARDGKYSEWMDLETEMRLRAYYEPRNKKLAAFLGRELPWL